jgi:cell division septum initiation protein DivIVA
MTASSDEANADPPGRHGRGKSSSAPGRPSDAHSDAPSTVESQDAQQILATARRQAADIISQANAQAARTLAEAASRERVLLGELQSHLTTLARAEQELLDAARHAITEMLTICRGALTRPDSADEAGPAKHDDPAGFKER